MLVQRSKLLQHLGQRFTAERLSQGRVEGNRRILPRQNLNPPLGRPRWHQVCFVQQQNHVLGTMVFPQLLLNPVGPGAHRVTSVQHLNEHVRRVNHLVQLGPDTLGLTLGKEVVTLLVSVKAVAGRRSLIRSRLERLRRRGTRSDRPTSGRPSCLCRSLKCRRVGSRLGGKRLDRAYTQLQALPLGPLLPNNRLVRRRSK
mmetsp:Transcript_8817/g.28138  ORF Transcript_8817/g.28138 Transcript_8817/m.28138 type:complete len:200 (-) Transcript_8817:503-1102(-)